MSSSSFLEKKAKFNDCDSIQLKNDISLKEVFNSTFHQKLDFDDLLNLDVKSELKILENTHKLIFNPSNKLNKYLRFLNSFIFEYAKINTEVVYSYRRGYSAYDAVTKHADSKYFFQTDIKSFFYSITIEDVMSVLDNNLDNAPINDIEKYRQQLLNLVIVDGKLPVGFSTSPRISNTCLYAFDNALEEYCLAHKIIYTRYSDDLILSSNDNDLKNIDKVVSKFLYSFFGDRFQLNLNKTKHTYKGKKIKLLGMVILPSGHITVDMKMKKRLEILLHFYLTDKEKFSDYLNNKYHGDLGTISGQLNYINTVDKLYLNKLRKKYGNFIVDTFCHKTVK